MKKHLWTMLGLALVLMVAMVSDASAATTIVGAAIKKSANVFQSVRTIVFVIGGFGLVGLAVQAIFGKVKWPWFGALAVGLGVLAAAGAIIEYATGDKVTQSNYADTFSEGINSTMDSNSRY